MDESTLRSAIQQRLLKDGTYDEITSQVRSALLNSLRNPIQAKATNFELSEVAWQSLIYHYLYHMQFVHTLSVFASECGLESGRRQLSLEDSMKVLGLSGFYDECKRRGEDQDIPAVIKSWLELHSKTFATVEGQSQSITVSVQTQTITQTALDEVNEHISYKSTESSLQEMERILRNEMNEKLRLSAKKQAINATRKVEEKFNAETNTLRKQIELEQKRSKYIDTEWAEKLARIEHSIEKERIDAAKKFERLLLEKETLESELALMNEHKKSQMKEWSDQQDALAKQHLCLQSEMNRTLLQQETIKATEDEKDELLQENQLLRKQLSSLHKAKDVMHQSYSQLKASQVKSIQEHRIKENTLKKDESLLKAQLQELEQKHQAALKDLNHYRLQLDRMKNEVSSLRSLLRQSQTALESVSFRDDQPSFRDCSKASRRSLESYRSTQLPLHSTPAARPRTTSSVKPTVYMDSSRLGPTPDRSVTPNISSSLFDTQQDEASKSEENVVETEHDEVTVEKETTRVAFTHVGCRDPPLLSPKDPPEDRPSADTPFGNLRMKTSLLFHSEPAVSLKTPPESIVHDHADDISAISEAISRQNFAHTSFLNNDGDVDSTDKMNYIQSRTTENEQNLDCNVESRAAHTEIHDTVAEENQEDDNINEAKATTDLAGPLSNRSIASVEPDTTMYTESFHSDSHELTDTMLANDARSTIGSQLEMQKEETSTQSPSQKSEFNHDQPDTPRSTISSHSSDGGYTASFCTEE